MNNVSKFLAGVLAGVVVVGMSQLSAQDNTRLESVKNGKLVLTCHLPKGITTVPKEVVTGYHSETGWTFSNGSAKSCWTD